MKEIRHGDNAFGLVWAERDCWPLTRLLVVALAFGWIAHWRFAWNPAWRDVWALPGGIAAIFLTIVALSSGLAHVVLVAAAIPLCGIILLNDWLYDLSAAAYRVALRPRSAGIIALAGLIGELVLFGGLAYAVHALTLHW